MEKQLADDEFKRLILIIKYDIVKSNIALNEMIWKRHMYDLLKCFDALANIYKKTNEGISALQKSIKGQQ